MTVVIRRRPNVRAMVAAAMCLLVVVGATTGCTHRELGGRSQALINNEGIPGNRVDVIYNGVDFGAYQPESADRRAIRRELGVGDDDLLIMQIARLDALKDHATAIRTL